MKQITCPFCGDSYPDFDVAHVCSKGPYGLYALKLKPKMNSRVRELMEEAGYAAPEMAGRAQRLVDLVVEECAKICNALQPIPASEPRHCAEDIIYHFGETHENL